MSSSEEIRAKRLARMAAGTQSTPKPKSTSTSSNPVDKVTPKPMTTKQPTKDTTPTHFVSSSVPISTPRLQKTQESFDDWSSNQLEYMLHASLSKDKARQKDYFYLSSLAEDAENEVLNYDSIDSVFVELLTEQGVASKFGSPLEYLFTTWKSSSEVKRIIRNDDPRYAQKIKLVNEVLRLSSSYTLIIFQVPDMFIDEVTIDLTVQTFWKQIYKYDGMLLEVVSRAIENDSVLELCNIVIPRLAKTLVSLDYTADTEYLKILDVYQLFLSNKTVASIFHEIDSFNPKGLKGNEFETKTLLGPVLRISPLLPDIAASNYTDGISKSQIRSIHESLQTEHSILVNRLFSICERLIRAGENPRQAFLQYLADIVNNNHLRRGEHADPEKIASDSFMFNLTIILVKFAQPFLASGNFDKIGKISSDYLAHSNKLIDLKEETKINSTIQEYDEYYTDDKSIDTPLNFISECFYMLLTYLHYGLGGIYISSNRLNGYIKQMTQQLKKFDEMLKKQDAGASQNPLLKMMIDTKIVPLKKELHKLKSTKLAIEMVSCNRNMQLEIFDIIIGSITFMMRLIEPSHKYPNVPLHIPLHNMDKEVAKLDDVEYLRSISPVPFKYFPEMFIEGIVNYCHYIAKFNNNPMFQNEDKLNRFVEFSITILRCPELVSNPHLKSRLIEVLFMGSLPSQNGREGYMIDIFNNNEMVRKNLMISFLDFYVMVEKTGSSSQFYDKFNARYHISFIIEQLWKYDSYKEDLKNISLNLQQFFVRLIARMLNDTTYLLDETLNHLHTIGSCQREIDSRGKGNAPSTDESDEDLAKKLQESERMAKSFVQLTNKTILLFNLFTEETPTSFTIVEIVDRLAGMLNYNLVALVGPKYNELRVKNPENYQFNPSELLFQLCSIFINLSDEQGFVDAVARDQRSFSHACFTRAIQILYKVGKVPTPEFETKLIGFANKAEQVKLDEEEEELELGDIPDEFLDPLMYTLMKDPVKLPHSKISMDRSVLKAHLMNDPTDPFNRTPLKLEDVGDDLELKNKIQEFIKERKASLKKHDGDGDGDTVMN